MSHSDNDSLMDKSVLGIKQADKTGKFQADNIPCNTVWHFTETRKIKQKVMLKSALIMMIAPRPQYHPRK